MNICLLADAQSIHIQQLTSQLARRGHRLHVITHKPAMLPGATVERYAVPPPGLFNLHRWAERRIRHLLKLRRDFDIVNVHFLEDWGLAEILGNREDKGAPVIASAWGSDIVHPPGEAPATTELVGARKALLHKAHAVTTCGLSFAAVVADFAGISKDSIRVAPFGVDLSLFQPKGKCTGIPAEPRIGFFKGFRPVYGPRILVRAVPEVLEKCPQARFEMIGAGKELDDCKALANRSGVAHAVSFEPPIPHKELPGRIQTWSLSVIPSIQEAFGVAALESQAMEVPVVASQVCGLIDTVRHGQTGWHFSVGKSSELAECILRLVQDNSEREQMGVAGRDMVARQYNWELVAGTWESLYLRVREEACVMV